MRARRTLEEADALRVSPLQPIVTRVCIGFYETERFWYDLSFDLRSFSTVTCSMNSFVYV